MDMEPGLDAEFSRSFSTCFTENIDPKYLES